MYEETLPLKENERENDRKELRKRTRQNKIMKAILMKVGEKDTLDSLYAHCK